MIIPILTRVLFIFLCSFVLSSGEASPFLFSNDQPSIIVNNRVLAHVNTKPITVLDVMKKMDILFLKQFPEYTSSPQARFQYYQINWRPTLQELIDKELLLADAEENKVTLTAGEVRQEMEHLFGPNVITNLDKIGLSFDEAFKIVQGDLTMRRMMIIRVNSKALRSMTPQVLKDAYDDFSKKNVRKEAWRYQVITVRNNDSEEGAETANASFHLLSEDKIPLGELNQKLQEVGLLRKSSVSVTNSLYHTEAEMSEPIQNAIRNLKSESYSEPFAQKSRSDKSTVFRIIYLQEQVAAGALPYHEIENQLKEDLYDKAIVRESEAYLKKLRNHYAIHESYIEDMVPADFQPFALK